MAVTGRQRCNMTDFFKGVQHAYCAKIMLTVFHNDNLIIYNI